MQYAPPGLQHNRIEKFTYCILQYIITHYIIYLNSVLNIFFKYILC